MTNGLKKTVLSVEATDLIPAQYTVGIDVVRGGLSFLQDPTAQRTEAVEAFIRNEILPAYEKMKADPESGLSSDEAFAELRKRIAAHEARRV